MPYRLPRQRTEQAAYNRALQEKYGATRRVPTTGSPTGPPPAPAGAPSGSPPAPAGAGPAPAPDQTVVARLKELARLHAEGALTDEEFTTAKARVLDPGMATP